MLWTAFPDELDSSALAIALAAFRGEAVDRNKAVLCGANLLGYSYHVLGENRPALHGAALDEDQIKAAFAQARTHGNMTLGAGVGAPAWVLTLLQISDLILSYVKTKL